jgi:dihydroneopterin aldolase
MDRIVLHNMAFYGYHGLSGEERELGGRLSVDVELHRDLTDAARHDDIAHTVDYRRVYQVVERVVVENRFKLLESLAEAVAEKLLLQLPVEVAVVRVRKTSPPLHGHLDWVGVEVRREREGTG